MTVNLSYATSEGFETLSYEVPESVVKFTEYTLKLKGSTSREELKEDIKKTFLGLDGIEFTIKRIEKQNHTKVFVDVEE